MISDYISLSDKEEYQFLAEEFKNPFVYVFLIGCFGAGVYLAWPLVYMPFLLLIPALFIDARHMILPDIITVPLLFLGLILAPISMTSSAIGALSGLFFFGLLEFVMTRAIGRPALGWGDVKLLAALGAWGGVFSLPLILVFASWSAIGFILYRNLFTNQNRSAPFPFGPFLIIGGVSAILYQSDIWNWISSF